MGGPFGDGSKRPGTGQHRSRRQGEDGNQWVAAAMLSFGFLEFARVGMSEVGEGGWDRG